MVGARISVVSAPGYLHIVPPGQSVLAGLVSLPPQFGLRLVSIEPGILHQEVKNEVVGTVVIDVFDVPLVNRSCTATGGDGLGRTESVSNVLAGRVELVCSEDGDGNDAATARVDGVRFASGFHIDFEFRREVGDRGTAERRHCECGHSNPGTGFQ